MNLFQKSFDLPLAGFIFSVLGAVYSILMALGIATEAVCLTSGCTMVKDLKVFGLSPWWWAFAAFTLSSVLCLLRLRALAYVLSVLFLLGDCVFLLVMIFIAPCTSCLLAALLIFCVWSALRASWRSLMRPRTILVGALGGFWFLLFLVNAGFAVEEVTPVWRISGREDASVTVYFSPSCPACRKAVSLFGDEAGWYPVLEGDKDIALLADLEARMESGQSLASAMADLGVLQDSGQYAPPEVGLVDGVVLRMKAMRNQSRLSRLGYNALPVIMFEGLPSSWADSLVSATPEDAGYSLPEDAGGESGQGLPLDFGETQQCGGDRQEPCD